MYQHHVSSNGTWISARLTTTLLASGWGLVSAYILFSSLLVNHNARYCYAALAPLIAVWATLERKRWGRLALLGLSATALGLSIAGIGRAFALANAFQGERSLLDYLGAATQRFSLNPSANLVLLLLAAMTGFWMCRPDVVAEFERGKKATLAVAQRMIALSLVGCWGLFILFAPMPEAQGAIAPVIVRPASPSASGCAGHAAHGSRKASSRQTRSAAAASSL
jgi:hypothetical protein